MLDQPALLIQDEVPRSTLVASPLRRLDSTVVLANVRPCGCVAQRDEVLCSPVLISFSPEDKRDRGHSEDEPLQLTTWNLMICRSFNAAMT